MEKTGSFKLYYKEEKYTNVRPSQVKFTFSRAFAARLFACGRRAGVEARTRETEVRGTS